MAKRIFKYPLELNESQYITIPKDHKILSVQVQRDTICVWALIDDDTERIVQPIRIVGTGHSIPSMNPLGEYIGTVQQGGFVWHVFKG